MGWAGSDKDVWVSLPIYLCTGPVLEFPSNPPPLPSIQVQGQPRFLILPLPPLPELHTMAYYLATKSGTKHLENTMLKSQTPKTTSCLILFV